MGSTLCGLVSLCRFSSKNPLQPLGERKTPSPFTASHHTIFFFLVLPWFSTSPNPFASSVTIYLYTSVIHKPHKVTEHNHFYVLVCLNLWKSSLQSLWGVHLQDHSPFGRSVFNVYAMEKITGSYFQVLL